MTKIKIHKIVSSEKAIGFWMVWTVFTVMCVVWTQFGQIMGFVASLIITGVLVWSQLEEDVYEVEAKKLR